MDRDILSRLGKLIRVLTVVATLVCTYSCTGEPRKPANIQGDGYAYTKEWATWYITNQLIKNGNVPSVVMALVDDQEVVWQEAFGYADLEEKKFASVDTVYRVASVSKPFTSLAIMKLYEEGVIDLDAPITDYLPDFSVKSRFPDSDPITIRSIMAHRAGLPSSSVRLESDFELESYERMSLEDIVKSLKDQYVAYPVGYRYKYQNVGCSLLGRIIEVVTGSEFADYMQDNILNPIGMNDSSFLSSPEIQGKLARGYNLDLDQSILVSYPDISDLPAGNLYTTLIDMTKALKFLFREGEVNGNQLIKKETLEMMYTDYYSKPRDPTICGLSWNLPSLSTGNRVVSKDGAIPGFATSFALLPDEKLGLIIIANTYTPLTPFGVQTLELMLETKLGIKPVEEKTPKAVHVDKTILEQYTGKYSFGFPVEVVLKNKTLQFVMPPSDLPIQGNLNLVPISETEFRFPTWVDFLIRKIIGVKVTFEFLLGQSSKEDIIVTVDSYSAIGLVLPKIPEVEEIPPLWDELCGEYTVEPYFKEETIGTMEVKIVNNVLTSDIELNANKIDSLSFVLNPISDTEILVVGDPYHDGDTIFYDKDTGYLRWAGLIAKPK
jgi:CubicO group peptidase (beta-lactamase class C family)